MFGLIVIQYVLALAVVICAVLGYSWQAIMLSLCIYSVYILIKNGRSKKDL